MRDYSLNANERNTFILYYEKKENNLFIYLANKTVKILPYTIKREEEILSKMKNQVLKAQKFQLKNYLILLYTIKKDQREWIISTIKDLKKHKWYLKNFSKDNILLTPKEMQNISKEGQRQLYLENQKLNINSISSLTLKDLKQIKNTL